MTPAVSKFSSISLCLSFYISLRLSVWDPPVHLSIFFSSCNFCKIHEKLAKRSAPEKNINIMYNKINNTMRGKKKVR